MAQVIVLAKGSLTAPLQPDDSGEPSGAGAELTLLLERRRVSPAIRLCSMTTLRQGLVSFELCEHLVCTNSLREYRHCGFEGTREAPSIR